MTTKTKSRPHRNGASNGKHLATEHTDGTENGRDQRPSPRSVNSVPSVAYPATVPIAWIKPSPTNPRQDYSTEALRELADSIREQGVLQPLVVRSMGEGGDPDRYELIAGERRWRAAQVAGLTHVPCMVHECDDREARLIQLVENLQREDLDPIAEARGFQAACQAGLTQTELAQRLGCTQAKVSNAIRLLDLPEPWLGRVIRREMSASHAQLLLPWKERPKLLKELERRVATGDGFTPGSLDQFEDKLRNALDLTTTELRNSTYAGHRYIDYRVDVEALEEKTRDALDLVEYNDSNGKPTTRAANVTLAAKLLGQARDAAIDAAEKQAQSKTAKGAKNAKGEKPKEPTAAELKARAKEKAEQTEKRIGLFTLTWRRDLVAAAIQAERSRDGGFLRGRVVLWFLARPTGHLYADRAGIEDLLEKATCVTKGTRKGQRELWPAIGRVEDKQITAVLADVLAEGLRGIDFHRFNEATEHGRAELAALIDGLVELLEINLAAEWDAPKGEETRRRFLELFDKEQLAQLAKAEWKIDVNPDHKKSQIINGLLAPEKHLALPKCLSLK